MPPIPRPPFFVHRVGGVHVISFGPGPGPWHGFIGLLLVAVVACAAVVVIAMLLDRRPRATRESGADAPRSSEASTGALQILDERFAKGEIDADDYTARRQLISASR